jgi:hypothetical protein
MRRWNRQVMRRLLSILLFWATLFPMVAPALTTGAMGQSMLPACCRRGGQHHCAMAPEERARLMAEDGNGAIRVGAPPEQCPYRQRSLAATHLPTFAPGAMATHAEFLLHQPSAAAQAECLRRISFDRARQKRGPPSLLG